MGRSGYVDDMEDNWSLICWRGAVASAIRGKRGQAFLREMLMALDALPKPELIADDLERDGAVCAIGAVGKARGIDMTDLDPEDREGIAAVFGISHALTCEIFHENDEVSRGGPWSRFEQMRRWCIKNLRNEIS